MPRKFFLAKYFQSILECFLLNFDHFLKMILPRKPIFFLKKSLQIDCKTQFQYFNADPTCLGTELPGAWLKDKTDRIFPVFAEDVGEQDQR